MKIMQDIREEYASIKSSSISSSTHLNGNTVNSIKTEYARKAIDLPSAVTHISCYPATWDFQFGIPYGNEMELKRRSPDGSQFHAEIVNRVFLLRVYFENLWSDKIPPRELWT
jgi:hypothetical protein